MNSNERKILADALKRYHDCAFTPGVYEHSIVGQAALILENYVEVVRCKDCKHYTERKNVAYNGHFCERIVEFVQPDDFCSYGERKDNG